MGVAANSKSVIDAPSLNALPEHGINAACLAVGVFDGVHKGHKLLLDHLLEMGRRHCCAPVALTFFPHPREVVNPDNPPSLLIPPFKKCELLHQYGVKAVITVPFSREFAAQSPEDFINDCLRSSEVAIRGLCVGSKWRFGAGGVGDSATLHRFARHGHFEFKAVAELVIAGAVVSSTAIRRAISAGQLLQAEAMLGRHYSLSGVVEKGHHIAGPELEHPTANLKISYGILPPDGVYAALAVIDGKHYPAAVNIGISPTYNRPDGGKRRVEAHIIGFERNLYGEAVEVELLQYLREERCFPSPGRLKQQIAEDIENIKQIVAGQNSITPGGFK